jgi:hypothetical protein
MTAPDSVPSWIYADSNLVDGGEVIAGQLARNVVVVAFDSAMGSAARGAALDRVRGRVVGGFPLSPELGGGFYFVRVNAATPSAILAAADTLGSVPGVGFAIPSGPSAIGLDSRLRPVAPTPTGKTR